MARIDFAELSGPARLLEQAATLTAYHIRNKRVTHTVQNVISCARHVVGLIAYSQSDIQFVKALRNAFEYAYDKDGGGMSFDVHDDNTISIHGSFKVEQLRRFMAVVPEAKTIESGFYTEHVNG